METRVCPKWVSYVFAKNASTVSEGFVFRGTDTILERLLIGRQTGGRIDTQESTDARNTTKFLEQLWVLGINKLGQLATVYTERSTGVSRVREKRSCRAISSVCRHDLRFDEIGTFTTWKPEGEDEKRRNALFERHIEEPSV